MGRREEELLGRESRIFWGKKDLNYDATTRKRPSTFISKGLYEKRGKAT